MHLGPDLGPRCIHESSWLRNTYRNTHTRDDYIPLVALNVRLGYTFCMLRKGGGLGNSVTLWNRFPNFVSRSMTRRPTLALETDPDPDPDRPELLPNWCEELAMCVGGVDGAFGLMEEWRCGGTGAAPDPEPPCKKNGRYSLAGTKTSGCQISCCSYVAPATATAAVHH